MTKALALTWQQVQAALYEGFQEEVSFGVSCLVHLVLFLMLAALGISPQTVTRLVIEAPPPAPEEATPPDTLGFVELRESEFAETVPEPAIQPAAWESPLEMPDVSVEDVDRMAGVDRLTLDSPKLIDVDARDLRLEVPERAPGGRLANAPGPLASLPPGLAEDFAGRLRMAGAQSGDVQVSLMWNNINDLDLHVLCPSGEEIYYFHPRSHCGGLLDVDMNVFGRRPWSNKPVENIFWPTGGSPSGSFAVAVDHYSNNGAPDPTKFWVSVKVAGGEVGAYEREISHGQRPYMVCRFENPTSQPRPVGRRASQGHR